MHKTQLSSSLLFFLIVIGTLLMLNAIPEINVNGFRLKKINILSDLQPDRQKPAVLKDPVHKKSLPPKIARNDSCRAGLTCLEDYSPKKKALNYFFRALKDTRRKPVRIAFFGDSFIEGDILTSSFRDTLQVLFGGKGVGYVPVASEIAQFRTSIQHTFTNWETYSIVGKKSEWTPLGTSGYCFVPMEDNMVEYRTAKKRNSLPFKNIRLFYSNPLGATVDCTINDTLQHKIVLSTTDGLAQTSLREPEARSIKFRFNEIDSLKVYGLSFEDNTGVYVDNLAMRGNSGMGLSHVSSEMNEQFNEFQDYKLIILQYGLNVVSEYDSLGYGWYVDKMVKVVNRLRANFPECSFLLIGVSDRSSNQNGKFVTIPFIPVMRDAQREIAQKCGIAFWDLYSAMGGENSMVKFVNAIPPLAAKDYTHLTFRGGKKIAKQLAETILFEREQYAKRK